MKLNIPERLTLVGLLPERGSFTTMAIIESLTNALYPSEDEVIRFEIKQNEEAISWNLEGAKQIEINLTKNQSEFIINLLEELGKREELTINHYKLLKRFMDVVNSLE